MLNLKLYQTELKRLGLLTALLSIHLLLSAQYEVKYNIDANKLVRNLFLGSKEIVIENIVYKGAPNAMAYFTYPSGKLGIHEGFLLTTGSGFTTLGPNNTPVAGVDNHHEGDEQLTALAKAATYDAAVLEFDFYPVSEFISFKYVFASEEYLEFVGRGYNDVFGFYLSGPGIKQPINLATVAGSEDIVSVNSINSTNNPELYVDNGSTNNPRDKDSKNKKPVYDNQIQFDGFTKVLKARYKVIPYKKYHIKLCIADVGDRLVDSAVYLEGKSFVAEGTKVAPPPDWSKGSSSTDPNVKRKPLARNLLIEFDFDKSEIPDTSRRKLYYVYKDVKDYLDIAKLEIYGHTDYVGSDAFNQSLSNRRVNAVVQYLVKLGYPRSNIVIKKGYGEKVPKAENATPEGRQRNRRVEVKVAWSKRS